MGGTPRRKPQAAAGPIAGAIRIGVGGWVFEPWRGTFYPPGLAKAKELHFASRQFTAVEVNGTFYRTQTAATFRKWADEAPDGFRFALKGPMAVANRRVLAETGDSIARFFGSGVAELGDKLGPVLWQFAPTRAFDADDVARFLALLPGSVEGLALRHAIEPRHESFRDPRFAEIARQAGVAVVIEESDDYPSFGDGSEPFVYARLQRSREGEALGYPEHELAGWAERAKAWAQDGKEVHLFLIGGAKALNPAAAKRLAELCGSVGE